MADYTSWIGGMLSYVTAARDPDATASDYNAKSYLEMGNIKTIGALGDTSNAISISILKEGRIQRISGERDGGEVQVAVVYDASDATYTAIRDLANANTTVWFEVEDAGGEKVNFQGLIANFQETERNGTTDKGATFSIRINSAFVYQ
jgi:hypothetical protein